MTRRGRPTKCTPEVIEEICKWVRQGNFIEPSCILAGVSERVYYDWKTRAEQELERIATGKRPRKREAIYVEFLQSVTRARAAAESEHVLMLKKQAVSGDHPGDSSVSQWFLERAFRDRWGKTKVEHTHEGKVSLEFDVEAPKRGK